ncbi:hypothetical protein DICVIV_06047 [Dictyocaulus viviparus]|uniref:DRBM domain-containing protein n=1 Tax=Dictyocaulus viviparus TaxID=29172 RepID=A0A0D8XVL2_DICVI|nr:hypothetical protein DICVIV_06047 [Dictyocaulus viviparus]
MPSLDDLFTSIDDLRLNEPSYFASDPIVNMNTAAAFSQKTPVMALDEGCRRVYGVAPDYQLIREVPNFGFSCHLMDKFVKGYAKTKKAAKHIAARAMLHEIIEKDRQSDFGIPGLTKEDAHRAVDGLVISDVRIEMSEEDPIHGGQNENYSGKLLQLCQKNKFDTPQYSYKEEGPPNDRTFTTMCKVVDQVVEGVAKTKKASKNIASQKMLAIITKGIDDMNKEFELDREADDDVDSLVDNVPCDVTPSCDAIRMVSDILSDTKRFESPTQEYRILEKKSTFGM